MIVLLKARIFCNWQTKRIKSENKIQSYDNNDSEIDWYIVSKDSGLPFGLFWNSLLEIYNNLAIFLAFLDLNENRIFFGLFWQHFYKTYNILWYSKLNLIYFGKFSLKIWPFSHFRIWHFWDYLWPNLDFLFFWDLTTLKRLHYTEVQCTYDYKLHVALLFSENWFLYGVDYINHGYIVFFFT